VVEMSFLYNTVGQKDLRKKLRNSLGLPEIILWGELKGSKLGKKFRRQYGVGKYSLDFYCPDLRLGIELDGSTHDNPESYAYDRERTNFINSQNIKIIRFQNKDVLTNLTSVVEQIKKNLK
jgi:very-short-patch-repair endonuclease